LSQNYNIVHRKWFAAIYKIEHRTGMPIIQARMTCQYIAELSKKFTMLKKSLASIFISLATRGYSLPGEAQVAHSTDIRTFFAPLRLAVPVTVMVVTSL
jgi:hypothetical protein